MFYIINKQHQGFVDAIGPLDTEQKAEGMVEEYSLGQDEAGNDGVLCEIVTAAVYERDWKHRITRRMVEDPNGGPLITVEGRLP